MIIAGVCSFKKGKEVIEEKFGNELIEIRRCINAVNSEEHKKKISKKLWWVKYCTVRLL